MSITEELRKYANELDTAASMMSEHGFSPVAMKLTAIADRIDAEHEREVTEATLATAERGWVRLPVDADGEPVHIGAKDADGEPIHIGDVMENITAPVHHEVTGVGVDCFYAWDDGNGRYSQFSANLYRHYHAPTVEDVLRELVQEMNENLGMYTGEAIDADEWRDADAKTIAEYAAKLRLAGDDE